MPLLSIRCWNSEYFCTLTDLERIRQAGPDPVPALQGMKEEMLAAGVFTPEEGAVIRPEDAAAYYRSPLGVRMLASPEVRREWAFNLVREEENMLVQGVIDCAFREEGGWVIVDYKTDRVENPGELAETYGLQLNWYAAALEASKGFFKAAGYTFDEATGMMTAAPEGAKLSYEVIIPADGIGDHPSFAILTDAKNALATIGFELKINDPADSNVLWDAMDAGIHEMWCAAWGSTIDPDMYQVYHSSNVVGEGGSDSNHYHIQSAELDQMILDARTSADQAYRKEMYKACLDHRISCGRSCRQRGCI